MLKNLYLFAQYNYLYLQLETNKVSCKETPKEYLGVLTAQLIHSFILFFLFLADCTTSSLFLTSENLFKEQNSYQETFEMKKCTSTFLFL